MISSSSSTASTSTSRILNNVESSSANSGVPRITGGDSSMRPRNKRLVSTEQELVSTSATNTPGGSRAGSPLPSRHPSRSVSRNPGAAAERSTNGRSAGGLFAPSGTSSRKANQSAVTGKGGLWDPPGWMSSWNALQGLASSVLGGDLEEATRSMKGNAQGKRPRKEGQSRKKAPEQWGPPEPTTQRQKDGGIGWGSMEEMQAEVRARKMRGVLEGREEEGRSTIDTNGNYKRRSSTEEQRPASSHEDDQVLVYIHHVQKQDTLQGVVLKYNCKPDVFRKANRLWPNDTVQIRETVVLPVDACAVKGRPCEGPSDEGVDLLATTPEIENTPSNGHTWPGTSTPYDGTSAERPEDSEHPWVHVRWVLLDSSPNAKPTEIARMPRKTLGYFPPRRRKSQTTISTLSTPRGSLEFPRIAQTHSNDFPGSTSTPARRTSTLGPRPSQPITAAGSYFPPQRPGTRSRRESVGEAADRLGWMRGPGGVGTFAKNVRKPGPAQDGLNAWAKKHVPSLAIDGMSSSSVLGTETAHFGFTDDLASIAEGPSIANGAAVADSGTSVGSLTPGGLGFENAAAAIEGWVRRLAIKAPGTPKVGGRDSSDLIELMDGTGSDDGRGFELSPPGRVRSSTPIGSGREDLDGLIRGRATAGTKGGKSD